MTNPPGAEHELWDELVAGHALHALEPEDERRLKAHLAGCARCTATLDDYSLVAAQLGSLSYEEADDAPSWQQLRERIVADPAPIISLERRHRHRIAARLLATAAAIVALAGGGVAAWQLSTHDLGSKHRATAAVSACQHQSGCRVIRLHTPSGGNAAAVLVAGERASVVPLAMADAPAGRTYVLWQLPRDGGPIPIAEFRHTAQHTAAAPLTSTYADTAAFAISLEPGNVTPSRPTRVLAIGTAA